MSNPIVEKELSLPIGVINVIMRAIYIEHPEAFVVIPPELAKALLALLPEGDLHEWAAKELEVAHD